ncbi:hypothetical protein MPTK1_2g24140 [Marchantia polymorpha subsp. ruderalis]|nr:hypothetical protein MARPO_0069s0063 [Marchantia polymorpha]BBN03520.1 hypothetical protein Mp_2g24140 [Marchantia polymorpha subsp. ruderalis]|eukprot:PTQ35726.1 hypothetical protein MARPO_0069s0063 [Marchantia polymorpha]
MAVRSMRWILSGSVIWKCNDTLTCGDSHCSYDTFLSECSHVFKEVIFVPTWSKETISSFFFLTSVIIRCSLLCFKEETGSFLSSFLSNAFTLLDSIAIKFLAFGFEQLQGVELLTNFQDQVGGLSVADSECSSRKL